MADKKTQLSIVLRAVDNATAKIKAINDRLDAATKPVRDFKKQLGDLREKSGLDDVIDGFKGVGSALAGILSKVAILGGVIGAAVVGLKSMVDEFDELGDLSEKVGFGADAIAQLRYAADFSGASVQQLDRGLLNFNRTLGEARAGTGSLTEFLKRVSPALLRQLKGAKSNEEALNLLADAMAKIKAPAKRAALAQRAVGDAQLAPLLAKGAKAIKELRDRYKEFNPDVNEAVEAAGESSKSFKDLKAATDGLKAALVTGLAPALADIVKRLSGWLKDNRERIKEWAADLGKRIPGAVDSLIGAVRSVVATIKPFVDAGWKLKAIAVVLAGIIVGPLVSAIYTLGVALLTTPVGWIVGGLAAIAAGAYMLIRHWDAVSGFFVGLWDTIAEKFGWAAHVIKLVLWPITGLATVLIGAWEPIRDFFTALWDGITTVFEEAWEVIRGIVDKIVAAVDFVANKVKTFIEGTEEGRAQFFDALSGGDMSPEARAMRERFVGGNSEAKVTVDFANAPAGTRVRTDPQSTADVDLSVGYQLIPGAP